MPQKKNPVVAETIRAKCGSVIGEATAAFSITKALPNSYNLDLQEVTPHLWRALTDTIASTSLMAEMLSSASLRQGKAPGSGEGRLSTATELANELVRGEAVPFRQAHQVVGELVSIAVDEDISLRGGRGRYLGEVSKKVAGRAIKIDKAGRSGGPRCTQNPEAHREAPVGRTHSSSSGSSCKTRKK